MKSLVAAFVVIAAMPAAAETQVSGYVAPLLFDGGDGFDSGGGPGMTLAFDGSAGNDAFRGVIGIRAQVLSFGQDPAFTHIPREAYLEYRGDGFDLRLGKQVILYGVADGYSPTNVVSPANFRFHNWEDHAERFGIWALAATFYPTENLTISLAYSPWQESSVLPALPKLGALSPDDDPIDGRSDDVTLRLSYSGQGLDAGLTAYHGAARTPILALMPGGAEYVVPDMNMLGGDLVWVSGPVRAFGEFALLDYTSPGGYGPRDERAAVLGLEYEISAETRLQGQAMYRHFDGDAPAGAAPALAEVNRAAYGQFGGEQTGASLTLRYDRSDTALSGDLAVASWFDGGDYYLRGRLKIRVNDRAAVYLRVDHYDGPSDSIFGSFEEQSRVAAEYRIQY